MFGAPILRRHALQKTSFGPRQPHSSLCQVQIDLGRATCRICRCLVSLALSPTRLLSNDALNDAFKRQEILALASPNLPRT